MERVVFCTRERFLEPTRCSSFANAALTRHRQSPTEYSAGRCQRVNRSTVRRIETAPMREQLAAHQHEKAPSRLPRSLPSTRLPANRSARSEEHTSELQSHHDIVCRLLLEK